MAAWALTGLLLVASGLDADVQRALARSGADRDGVSIVVGRAGAKSALFSFGAGRARGPASNQKILTAAAALQALGRDFRFQTTLAKAGEDLIVIGDGDPNLSGRFFDGDPSRALLRLAADAKRQGLKRVRNVVLDASRFDDVTVHPDWPADQLDRWYCAPVAALVFNDSCWDVTVGPRAGGGPAVVKIEPSLLRPKLANSCVTSRRQAIRIGRGKDGGLSVGGTASGTYTGHVTVRDPVDFFGRAFVAALKKQGIEVTGSLRRGRAPGAAPLVIYRSTLQRTLPVMLGNSQNLYAECVFKRLGDGTFAGGAKAMLAALQELGVDTEEVVPRDGSGLSRENRLTARALYQCLQKFRDEPMFVNALAAGGEGTLRRRYRWMGERIRAKTGTIRNVSALSGYVTGRSGVRHVFVVIANGKAKRNARKLQDLLVKVLEDA